MNDFAKAASGQPRPILFSTPCQWIKFDLDPTAKLDFNTPMRGVLRATDTTLEFAGDDKSYDRLVAAVNKLTAQWTTLTTAVIPLSTICRVEAISFTSSFLFLKRNAVRLEALYKRAAGAPSVRKIVCLLHIGKKPEPDPRTFYLEPALRVLYREENEAFNWERILRYLIEARQF